VDYVLKHAIARPHERGDCHDNIDARGVFSYAGVLGHLLRRSDKTPRVQTPRGAGGWFSLAKPVMAPSGKAILERRWLRRALFLG
jgi:hypothetical protein